MKYYAVKKGYKTGVFISWDECKASVDGYSGAVYKSFRTNAEALEYLGLSEETAVQASKQAPVEDATPYAYVDGSFNQYTGTFGYGGFLIHGDHKYILQGNGRDNDLASMRNVAGEIFGSVAAVRQAMELGLKELVIYYDYEGIRAWAEGTWKANKEGTIAYRDFIQSAKKEINLRFIHVKGHSGVEGNEEADILAKEAVGLKGR